MARDRWLMGADIKGVDVYAIGRKMASGTAFEAPVRGRPTATLCWRAKGWW